MKNRTKNIFGFTLIEVMVSLAIFSVVAVVAAGALLRILDSNKKAQSIQAAITNLNFALESMSRELRTGTKYQCNSIGVGSIDGYDMTSTNCVQSSSANPNGSYIAFRSAKSCASPSYYLAYEYRFKPVISAAGTFTLEKAEQSLTNCSSHAAIQDSDFVPVISSNNVTITGYNIAVKFTNGSSEYPLATIRISGYTGVREKDRTYFSVETAASARVP